MKYFLIIFLCLPLFVGAEALTTDSLKANRHNYNASVELQSIATANGQVPFWMRSKQFGSIPLDGLSVSMIANATKDYQKSTTNKLTDWGFGFNLRSNTGATSELIPVEAYLKGRLSIFQLKIGRSKDMSGLLDTTLSSGSFNLSGNALGVPKVELGIPEFWSLPYTNNLIAFKGKLMHGWMGKVRTSYHGTEQKLLTYYYHLSVYGRLGKPNWKLKLYGGINHDVIWGSDDLIFGDQYQLKNNLQAFWYVSTGKHQKITVPDISKIGNHLGTIDAGFQYETENISIFAYRQQFYEKGALYYLVNLIDGLNNITITNKKYNINSKTYDWHKFLFELFYSKNQAGEAGAKETPSGPEYYYNHATYPEGYSYKGLSLGNPFITAADNARPGLPHHPANFFINNRVLALHFGSTGRIKTISYTAKLSWSRNWGEHRTSGIEYQWYNGTLRHRTYPYGIFQPVNQFSGLLELNYPVKNNYSIGMVVAADKGELLNNSLGCVLKLVKAW